MVYLNYLRVLYKHKVNLPMAHCGTWFPYGDILPPSHPAVPFILRKNKPANNPKWTCVCACQIRTLSLVSVHSTAGLWLPAWSLTVAPHVLTYGLLSTSKYKAQQRDMVCPRSLTHQTLSSARLPLQHVKRDGRQILADFRW